MKKINENILKLKKYCMSDDCAQLMASYSRNMTILDSSKIIYHSFNNTNAYLTDERKNKFPYSNIPTHVGKILGCNFTYVNGLFDYNTPYIIISDGYMAESFILRNGNEAFLVCDKLNHSDGLKCEMSKEEILEFISPKDNNEKVFMMNLNGEFFKHFSDLVPNSDEIIKKRMIERIDKSIIKLTNNRPDEYVYIVNNKSTNYMNFILLINLMTLDELRDLSFIIDDSYETLDGKRLDNWLKLGINGAFDKALVARLDGKEIRLSLLEISYISQDKYGVIISNIPIKNYTLNDLDLSLKVRSYGYDNISTSLNPNIKREDIRNSKKMMKKMI